MFRQLLHDKILLALPPASGDMSVLRWFADIVNGRHNPRIDVMRNLPRPPAPGHALSGGNACAPLCQLSKSDGVGMLLAEWDNDEARIQEVLQYAAHLDIPALVVRPQGWHHIRRVVVASAGGPHTLQHMWIAKEISEARQIPVKMLRILHPDDQTAPVGQDYLLRDGVAERWTSRLLGIMDIEEIRSTEVARGIARHVENGDLLIMGAPGPFHIAGSFADSMPAVVARLVHGPILLMHAGHPQTKTLRNLFWGRLIQTGVQPHDRRDIIETLVAALISHNQAPPSALPDLVERAMRRERLMPTAVDCHTAFPHIRLPGFRGVAASLAICPQGVMYGAQDGSLTHFFFLFITSDGFCDEYLAVLGKIARRMLRPEVRESLLKASTPAEVLDVLDPRQIETC